MTPSGSVMVATIGAVIPVPGLAGLILIARTYRSCRHNGRSPTYELHRNRMRKRPGHHMRKET